MINPSVRNIINPDNYEFLFIKLLASKGIEIQNDVLTKEILKTNWLMSTSTFFGIISTAIMMYNYYNYTNPDTTVRAAGLMAAGASTMFNRTNTLVNGAPCFTIMIGVMM